MRTFAAQMGGNGTAHPVTGDTWTVNYTTGGVARTQTGRSDAGTGLDDEHGRSTRRRSPRGAVDAVRLPDQGVIR